MITEKLREIAHKAARFLSRTVFIQTLTAKGLTQREAKQLWKEYELKLQVAFCLNCNTKNVPGSRKCVKCGHPKFKIGQAK